MPAVGLRFAAQRDAGEHPQQPGRGVDLDALDVLFAVLAGEVQRERAELPRLRRDGPRDEPGIQPGGLAQQPSTSKNEDGVASAVPGDREAFRGDPRARSTA